MKLKVAKVFSFCQYPCSESNFLASFIASFSRSPKEGKSNSLVNEPIKHADGTNEFQALEPTYNKAHNKRKKLECIVTAITFDSIKPLTNMNEGSD